MASILDRISQFWAGPNDEVVPEGNAPPDTETIVSRAGASFAIPGAWMKAIALNEDAILQRGGGAGLKLYDELLDDDVAMSNFQQRRLAVVSKDWEVMPGDDSDPRSVEAADHLRMQLKQLPFDRICDKMLFGIWHGYSVGEGLYRLGSDGKYWLRDVVVPDRSWFGFTNEGELKMRPGWITSNEQLPENKFWVLRTGASHDFAFYGMGLAHWCYWPIWFKRNVIKFWALYLEKLGYPTVVGETLDGMTDDEKSELMASLVAIGRDRAVRLPQGYLGDKRVQLIEAARSGAGTSSYLDFVTEQNEAMMRVILGQPGTSKSTPQGIGSGQADLHGDVKSEIVKADSDLLCESFNGTFPRWLTAWNFGEDVAPPRVYRILDDAEDLGSIAERDVKLESIGIRRTDESVEEVYGAGYERVEKETPPQLIPAAPGINPAAQNDDELEGDERELEREEFAAQDVAPLYVYRQLREPRELLKYIRSAGIPNPTPADELHVTVLYSRTPVDWFQLSDGWEYSSELKVPEGGARKVERFGEYIVLRFASEDLQWSHERKIRAGASHDHPEFNPHVTLGHDPDETVDLDALEAFTGPLLFGPEMFEDLKAEGPPALKPIEFAAGDEDAIERLAKLMADETNPVMMEFGQSLQEALEGVESPDAVRVALLNAFERMPAERMAAIAGLPLLSERMAAEAGLVD